jgi:hypothetical protein
MRPVDLMGVWHSGDLFTSTAQQTLLTRAGYGVAVMANTGLAYGDAQAIAHRIVALLEGKTVPPAAAWAYVLVDALFIAFTAGALLLAVRGVRLSHRRAAGPVRRSIAVARLLPLLTPRVLLVMIHRVMGALYRGRDVAWIQVPYLFPTFMLLLVTVSVGSLIVFMARVAHCCSLRPRRRRSKTRNVGIFGPAFRVLVSRAAQDDRPRPYRCRISCPGPSA